MHEGREDIPIVSPPPYAPQIPKILTDRWARLCRADRSYLLLVAASRLPRPVDAGARLCMRARSSVRL